MPSFPTNEYFDQAPGGILIYGEDGLRYANPAAVSLLAGAGFPVSPGDPLPPALADLSGGGSAAVIPLGLSEFQVYPRRLAEGLLIELHPQPPDSSDLTGQFARLSDRLRLPLSRLLGTLEQLPKADTPEQRHDIQAASLRNLCCLIRTVNALQLYGALSSGQSFSMAVLDLAGLCRELCAELESLLELVQIRVSWQIKAAPLVLGSRTLLRLLLLNLVSNAVSAKASQITLTLSQADGKAKLTLSDNGRSFPPERLKTAFSPAQAPSGIGENGLNLGLPVCQKIARLHKGTLLLDTASGSGTSCVLSLPVSDRSQPEVHEPDADFSAGCPDYLVELSDVLPPSVFQRESWG